MGKDPANPANLEQRNPITTRLPFAVLGLTAREDPRFADLASAAKPSGMPLGLTANEDPRFQGARTPRAYGTAGMPLGLTANEDPRFRRNVSGRAAAWPSATPSMLGIGAPHEVSNVPAGGAVRSSGGALALPSHGPNRWSSPSEHPSGAGTDDRDAQTAQIPVPPPANDTGRHAICREAVYDCLSNVRGERAMEECHAAEWGCHANVGFLRNHPGVHGFSRFPDGTVVLMPPHGRPYKIRVRPRQ